MDALRAQMALRGYEIPDPSPNERERVWYSLAGRRRQARLAQRDTHRKEKETGQ
jgi:hypothetical protein